VRNCDLDHGVSSGEGNRIGMISQVGDGYQVMNINEASLESYIYKFLVCNLLALKCK